MNKEIIKTEMNLKVPLFYNIFIIFLAIILILINMDDMTIVGIPFLLIFLAFFQFFQVVVAWIKRRFKNSIQALRDIFFVVIGLNIVGLFVDFIIVFILISSSY